jgi:tetratricopeptide (TPR) repeat protein
MLEERNDPWVHFYLGGAYGYRGFARFRKWNFIGAYKDASKGIDHFKKLLAIDSTVYDVYLGLGSYYYWRTAKSTFIRIIAFWMSDKRELGIEQLKFTIQHGRYASNEAIYVLLATYYDAKRFEEARELLNHTINKKGFANLTDLYFKGRIAAVFEDWAEVESAFSEILARLEKYKYPSIGYQVECKYWIAKAKSEHGEAEQALQLANQALELSKQRNEDKEIEGHIDSFNDIKKYLEELFKDLNKMALKGSL